jgi:hypothetical protein
MPQQKDGKGEGAKVMAQSSWLTRYQPSTMLATVTTAHTVVKIASMVVSC